MKVFEKDYKMNFVDENNVLVGYDFEQSCCEQFGWFLSNEIPNESVDCDKEKLKTAKEKEDLTHFVFDTSY